MAPKSFLLLRSLYPSEERQKGPSNTEMKTIVLDSDKYYEETKTR